MSNLIDIVRTDPSYLLLFVGSGIGLYYAAKLLSTVLVDYWRGERLLRRWREKGLL